MPEQLPEIMDKLESIRDGITVLLIAAGVIIGVSLTNLILKFMDYLNA